MYRVNVWTIQLLLGGQWGVAGRNRGRCDTLECEEKNALGVCCSDRDRRLRRGRVDVGDMWCLIAQLQHILARSGRRRTVLLRRLSILVASEPTVLFLWVFIGPSAGCKRLQKKGGSVDWTVAMMPNIS